MTQVRIGLLLTVAVGAVIWAIWGRNAAAAGVIFGLLAVLVQLAAVRLLKPAIQGSFRNLAARWLMGTGLRLGGVVVWAVAVMIDRTMFPPLATAVGYLGVLVPLLFMEMRFLK